VNNPLTLVAKAGYRLLSVSAASRVSDIYLGAKFDYLALFAKKFAPNIPIPKVTLVIPVYNVQRYLELCLKSVRAQRYPNLDVILVNDGSTDGSLAIARKHQEKLPLHIVDQENAGLGAARNAGVASIGTAYATNTTVILGYTTVSSTASTNITATIYVNGRRPYRQ
jgi:CDP-glycerol glycerophosphotransferase